MIECLLGLGNESVTLVSRLQEGDGVLYAERDIAVRVGDCCKGKVGKGEIRSTLTHSRSIEMSGFHLHLSSGITLAHLSELHTVGSRKAVAFVQKFL